MTLLKKQMYKQIFLVAQFCALLTKLWAQKGNNVLSINAEGAIPIFQDNTGYGVTVKGLYGIGKSGQLTFSCGVVRFRSKNAVDLVRASTRLIPFLAGYKYNFRKFFIEPRIALGELGGRISTIGDYSRPSVAAVFGGLSAGYSLKGVSLGISFLSAGWIVNPSAGTWYNKNFQYKVYFWV